MAHLQYALLNKKALQFRPNGKKKLCKFIDLNITLRKTGILASLKLLADVIAILMCSIKCFNHVFSLGWLFFLLRKSEVANCELPD